METNQLAQAVAVGPRTLEPDTEPASLKSWFAVLSVAVGSFAFVATEYLPVGLLPQIAHDLNVTPGTAGLMVTTPGLIAAISAPALLIAAGKINRRFILLMLSVLLLASNIVSAVAPSFTTMLIGRALLGASLGGFWTVALGSAGQLVQEKHAPRATAMIFMGLTLATVVGVPLGTLIANLSSWRMSFAATGVLVALALLAQMVFLPALPPKAAIRLSDLTGMLARANVRKSLLMVGLVFGAHFSSYTYIAPFLQQNAGFSLPAITAVLLGFGFAGFVANFAVSAFVAQNLKRSLGSMVVLVAAALVALPWLGFTPAGVIGAVLAWGVAYGAIPLCLSVWMQLSSPDQPEAGSALFVSTVQIAIAAGSLIGGEVVDHLGIPATMRLGTLLAVIGLLVIASFRTRGVALKELLANH